MLKKFAAVLGLLLAGLFMISGAFRVLIALLTLIIPATFGGLSEGSTDSMIMLAIGLLFAVFGFSGCKMCWNVIRAPRERLS